MGQNLLSGFKGTTCFILGLFLSSLIPDLVGQNLTDTLRISLTTSNGMQFDPVRFSVRPRDYVKLVFYNADEMEHNLIIGRKNSRERIVAEALSLGQEGPVVGYIPSISEVLWAIPSLPAGAMDSIVFRAPSNTGVYPYVCTFPGHGSIMYGAMHVTNGVMPKIAADVHVPEHRRKGDDDAEGRHTVTGHPYQPEAPYLYRVFMPDAGPAAIAVCLPGEINYCWDAGSCRLRYAWLGEFLDLTDYWTIKGELHARILGTVFYRDQNTFPIQTGPSDEIPRVKFRGYRLVEGYPEFHYQVNEVDVFEMILPQEDGLGLIRRFRITGSKQPIRFIHKRYDGVICQSDKGYWQSDTLTLNAQEAAGFSIMVSKSSL